MKKSLLSLLFLSLFVVSSLASSSQLIAEKVHDEKILETKKIKEVRVLSHFQLSEHSLTIRAFESTFSFPIVKRHLLIPNYNTNDQKITTEAHPIVQIEGKNKQDHLSFTLIDDQGTFVGSFWSQGELYHVDSISTYLEQMEEEGIQIESGERQVIYKESSMISDDDSLNCKGAHPNSDTDSESSDSAPHKRQTFADPSLPLPAYNCPTSPKLLDFSIALDYKWIAKVKAMGVNYRSYAVSQVNKMSALYSKTVNVKFQINGIHSFETASADPAFNAPTCGDISSKLYQFSQWRGSQNQTAGLWHLLTDCYTSGTVGLAWKGVLCTKTANSQGSGQWVSGTGVSSLVSDALGWKVLSHEVGHNFGSDHTATGIMTASISPNVELFSKSAQEFMCKGIFSRGNCLRSESCTPNCSGKNCGDNGCGGSCGTCASSGVCSTGGTCTACQPACQGKSCGDNGCGGSCGTCAAPTTCNNSTRTCLNLGAETPQNVWINLHNAERTPFGLNGLVWDDASAQVASSYAAQCVYGHNANRGPRGENIAVYSGNRVSNIQGLFQLWAAEKTDWDCANNAAINGKVVGHYTQLVWGSTTGVGCAIQYCTKNSPFGASFPDWTFAVCDYVPPGNYVGQRPFEASRCGGTTPPPPCTPTTSCAAQGRDCGTISDGCKQVNCGSCPTNAKESTCNSQGKCFCNPAGTCATAKRTCGSYYDGCNTLNCGACASGSTCSSTGTCVQDPKPCVPTTSCALLKITCGTINNGCQDVTCGGCITPQTCMQGKCSGCSNCNTFASCVNNACTCLAGYKGDGYTCTPVNDVPVRGTDAWESAAGDLGQWVRVGVNLENTGSGLSGVNLIGSGAMLTNEASITWAANVVRTTATAQIGLLFASTNNFFWTFAIDGSKVYLFAVCGGSVCSQLYQVGSGTFPVGQSINFRLTITNGRTVEGFVNGASTGRWSTGSGWAGNVGLFKRNAPGRFTDAVLRTSKMVSISLVECLSADQFKAKISGVLGIDQSQIGIVQSNCKKRQEGTFLYNFELLGSSETSASALESELATKVIEGHPSLDGNAFAPSSALEAVPESTEGIQIAAFTATAAAAALSTGAIVGIAVGGGVGLAAVAGGAVAVGIAVKKKKEEEQSSELETRTRGVDLLSSPQSTGHSSITARAVPQT